jgi:hypothetical protein
VVTLLQQAQVHYVKGHWHRCASNWWIIIILYFACLPPACLPACLPACACRWSVCSLAHRSIDAAAADPRARGNRSVSFWDGETDGSVTVSWQNDSLLCVVLACGLAM